MPLLKSKKVAEFFLWACFLFTMLGMFMLLVVCLWIFIKVVQIPSPSKEEVAAIIISGIIATLLIAAFWDSFRNALVKQSRVLSLPDKEWKWSMYSSDKPAGRFDPSSDVLHIAVLKENPNKLHDQNWQRSPYSSELYTIDRAHWENPTIAEEEFHKIESDVGLIGGLAIILVLSYHSTKELYRDGVIIGHKKTFWDMFFFLGPRYLVFFPSGLLLVTHKDGLVLQKS